MTQELVACPWPLRNSVEAALEPATYKSQVASPTPYQQRHHAIMLKLVVCAACPVLRHSVTTDSQPVRSRMCFVQSVLRKLYIVLHHGRVPVYARQRIGYDLMLSYFGRTALLRYDKDDDEED